MAERNNGIVTQDKVTRLFNFRTELWAASDGGLQAIAQAHGMDQSLSRKDLFNLYFQKNFNCSKDRIEQYNKLRRVLDRMQNFFHDLNSRTSLLIFGSFPKEAVNGLYSDLDFVGIVPQNTHEVEVFRRLNEAGIILSDELGPIDDVAPLTSSGRGLVRLYGMSQEGIETEFHLLGQQDAVAIPSLYPGAVQRVRPVSPKMERRISFAGQPEMLPKASDRVWHYHKRNSASGQDVFKGFFPDTLVLGKVVYDPEGVGQKIIDRVWREEVKAYLFHNGCYVQSSEGGYAIDTSKVNFDNFVETLVVPADNRFSLNRYKELHAKFEETILSIALRYGFVIL